MNPRGARRLIDWIWTVRGSLPLAPGQSGDEAFARLDPLFREPGTTRRREGDAMAFQKTRWPYSITAVCRSWPGLPWAMN
jgi:hypothetical protein